MKSLFLIVLIALTQIGWGQKSTCSTTEFIITGKIKSEMNIKISDLDTFQKTSIKDFAVTSHTGEQKRMALALKGILIKNILSKAELLSDNPKVLSEFYFIFLSCDGYKVVYSWNEIFNTETGNNIFLITEKEGVTMQDFKDGILVVASSDFKTGRRYIKGLSKIIVRRAE